MVALVSIHHEGAGKPTDVPRGADGGYSVWIGASQWIRLRSPSDSFATLNFNRVSLDVCLSGDRMVHPVTDNDIRMIHGAFEDYYRRGEVAAQPNVRAHRNSPGSSTVCPGDQTMLRWPDVVAACRHVVAPPPEDPDVMKPTDAVDAIDYDGGVLVLRHNGTIKLAAGAKGRGDFSKVVARRGTPAVSLRLDGQYGYVAFLSDGAVATPGQT